MAWAFFTAAQLSRRLGPATMRRIYDDMGAGSADSDAIAQLIADASGKVAGVLRGLVSLDAVAAAAAADEAHEVVRLSLDVAVAMAAIRHRSAVPDMDGIELMKQADRDLKMLRESYSQLDTDGSPNPPANVGASALPDPTASTTPTTFRGGGFGDF